MNNSPYKQFIFSNYNFDETTKELTLTYSLDDKITFNEIYTFDFDFAKYDPRALRLAIENLFFMAGVSYYKTYIPPEIVIAKGELDQELADFFSKTYQRGLGEFWYVNDLDPNTPVNFPANTAAIHPAKTDNIGLLASIGGGKDSLVTVELLKTTPANITTWSLNHKEQLSPLIKEVGLPHIWVKRSLDYQLKELNEQGALNGHVPISAIFACVGAVVAVLSGKRDIVMSNEQSANEPSLEYRGVQINHQYSKSQEFEKDYQSILAHCFDDGIRYYSLLRPFSELRIAELFAEIGFEKYKKVFSSCNRAYTLNSDKLFWCGECPKCAFTFLALTPFVPREELEKLWGGKNLLLDPGLENTYKELLGINRDKPLECVGEIRESRTAMVMAQQQYLELLRYHFELPPTYNYKTLQSSSMPEEMLRLILSII